MKMNQIECTGDDCPICKFLSEAKETLKKKGGDKNGEGEQESEQG